MSQTTPPNGAEELDTKAARLAHPNGWPHLIQHESAAILIDALLYLPPGREFNKTEFANPGVTR